VSLKETTRCFHNGPNRQEDREATSRDILGTMGEGLTAKKHKRGKRVGQDSFSLHSHKKKKRQNPDPSNATHQKKEEGGKQGEWGSEPSGDGKN